MSWLVKDISILGQIIKIEPNVLVDGESGSVICSFYNAYSIRIYRSGVSTIAQCSLQLPIDCSIEEPGPENNYTNYREFYTASKTTASLIINIDTVSKPRDSGFWTCRVENLQSNNFQNNITIEVKVPVKGVQIENKNSLNLVNGVSTTMNCKVTNNPDPVPNYRWFIVETDQTLSTSSSFQLTPKKNQNGQTLSCSADNGYGSSKSDTTILDIQYKPGVKIEPEVSGKYKIIEGNTVELKCIVIDANPNDAGRLNYKWYKDTTTNLPGQVGSTVQISQKGIYTCSVSNGIGTGISDFITIEVLFPPRVNLSPQYSTIEFNTLSIPCKATSNPLPNSYSWSGPNNFLQSQQNLTISSINRNQTGQYTCTVTNTMIPTTGGQQTSIVTDDTDVTVLSTPNVPSNITVIPPTSTICVEWTPEFNGGASQSFIVQHSTDNNTWVNSSTIPDRANNGRVDYCIEGLKPDTNYNIRVTAINKYGESLTNIFSLIDPSKQPPRQGLETSTEYSKPISYHTSGYDDAYNSGYDDAYNSGFGAGIGTGLGIAATLVVVVITAVFIYKYKTGKQMKADKIYDGFNTRSEDTQTYQELDTVQNTATTHSDANTDIGRNEANTDDGRPYANLSKH